MSDFAPSPRKPCLAALDVLVLAGGLGRRIRSVLPNTPKLLAPIAGRPYLAYLLEWLATYGTRRVILGLGYQSASIIDHLARHPAPGIAIETVVESEPLGTAGAVRLARPRLGTDPVLIMNGDSFVDADLCEFVARHRHAGATGTILCTEVSDAGRYGRIVLDGDGRILRFAEKDTSLRGTTTINAGIYLLSATLLDTIAGGVARSLEQEIFAQLPPGALAALSGCYRFIDIGTPESLSIAAEVLAQVRS